MRFFIAIGLIAVIGCGDSIASRNESSVSNTVLVERSTETISESNVEERIETDPTGTERRSAENPVTATMNISREKIGAGESFEISIVLEIAPFYEIRAYRAEPTPVSTSLELTLPEGLQAADEWIIPESVHSETSGGHWVYTGQATFTREISVPSDAKPGNHELSCSVRYQACTANYCLQPTTRRTSTTIAIQR